MIWNLVRVLKATIHGSRGILHIKLGFGLDRTIEERRDRDQHPQHPPRDGTRQEATMQGYSPLPRGGTATQKLGCEA